MNEIKKLFYLKWYKNRNKPVEVKQNSLNTKINSIAICSYIILIITNLAKINTKNQKYATDFKNIFSFNDISTSEIDKLFKNALSENHFTFINLLQIKNLLQEDNIKKEKEKHKIFISNIITFIHNNSFFSHNNVNAIKNIANFFGIDNNFVKKHLYNNIVLSKQKYNPYKLLKIKKGISFKELKLAYYSVAKKYHPDTNVPGLNTSIELLEIHQELFNLYTSAYNKIKKETLH